MIRTALQRSRLLRRAALTVEILWFYALARRTLAKTDLPTTLARLRRRTQSPGRGSGLRTLESIQLGGATVAVLGRLPTDERCLIRSLVVSGLLDRRGIESVFVLGVTPGSDFIAHAWVEVGDRAVIDAGDPSMARLTEL